MHLRWQAIFLISIVNLLYTLFLCPSHHLISLFRFCPGVFSLDALFLAAELDEEPAVFALIPVCLLCNEPLPTRGGFMAECLALKLSFSHLERRSEKKECVSQVKRV